MYRVKFIFCRYNLLVGNYDQYVAVKFDQIDIDAGTIESLIRQLKLQIYSNFLAFQNDVIVLIAFVTVLCYAIYLRITEQCKGNDS